MFVYLLYSAQTTNWLLANFGVDTRIMHYFPFMVTIPVKSISAVPAVCGNVGCIRLLWFSSVLESKRASCNCEADVALPGDAADKVAAPFETETDETHSPFRVISSARM
ncbi:hypothetical protein GQX74_008847 [Glossina fuscipes]|nr:hypothetical protein GQX74_008847 [Glossina fuscipes]